MITIATPQVELATCPVCKKKDVRVRPTGKLFNHCAGRLARLDSIIPGCAYNGFKLCQGSGALVHPQLAERAGR